VTIIEGLRAISGSCDVKVLRLHPSVPKEAKTAKCDDVLPDKTKVYKGG